MALSTEERKLAETLKKSGKSNADVIRIIATRRSGNVEIQEDPLNPKKSVLKDVAIGAAKGVGKTASFLGKTAASVAPGLLLGAEVNALPGVREATGAFADKFQGAVGLTEENLRAENTAQKVGMGLEIGAEFLSPFVASRLAGLASKGVSLAKTATVPELPKLGGSAEKALGAIKNPKLLFAKQNVGPQLEASAERLKNPAKAYDEYVTLAKKSVGDVKVDDPLRGPVAEATGDAFKSVISQRKEVGKTMSEELKKISDVKANILPTVDTFVSDLTQEGLTYDRVAKQIVQQSKQVKMTADDLDLIEKYGTELQRLGSRPTVGELDAFISRITGNLVEYKSSKNIIGTTNGERIVKKSLSSLRESFNPEMNKAFGPYYEARKKYSELSNFIEEGAGFLGKLTQSGDFVKDASLLKGAVTSLVQGGRKDWLVKLEELTGYPALDDAVLALQAMDDVGIAQGKSLLSMLSEGVPTPSGITQKMIDFALEKVRRVVAGTPEEQTRAFLNALEEAMQREALQ